MLSCVLLVAVQGKVQNYEIFRSDKLVGTAKIAVKITADGGKRSDSKLELTSGEQKLDMHTTQMWAKSGRPTLKVVQIFEAKGAETSRTRVDFHATDLLVTQTVGSKITKTTKTIPAGAEIRDLPEFWFLRDVPAKGKAYKYFVFNATSLEWEAATSTYMGKDTKTSKLHDIRQQIGPRKFAILSDEGGIPVSTVTNDGIRLMIKS